MWIGFIFCFFYICLLTAYRQGWKAIPKANLPDFYAAQTTLTVLIPARNEAENIGACLQSIKDGDYPSSLLEIIVLDDFSTDNTTQVASAGFQATSVIQLADHLPPGSQFTPNKKQAIELGVAQATGEIIVTTDADCIAPKNWLLQIAAAFEKEKTQMVCAPVVFHQEKNLLQRFQALDFLGLMGITAAGYQMGWHQMANGANLAYRKQVFENVGGYTGNAHLSSGDDMFLVQKVEARWPGSVRFLKSPDATVLTTAPPGWREFWQQRLRWGTKNAAIPSWPLRLSLLAVFLFCWSIWVNLALAIYTAAVGDPAPYFELFLFQIGIKVVFDYFFLSEMSRFFKREDLFRWFLPSFFLHTAYIALLGTASIFFKNYEWKGRKAK